MTRAIGSLILMLCVASMIACTHVSPEAVYGTYVAGYPFGRDTITLARDGHFSQQIEVDGQGQQTFSGTWHYSQRDGYIEFHHLGCIADGFGKLKDNWRTDVMEMSYQPVERTWFKLTINSGARFPYIKQRARVARLSVFGKVGIHAAGNHGVAYKSRMYFGAAASVSKNLYSVPPIAKKHKLPASVVPTFTKTVKVGHPSMLDTSCLLESATRLRHRLSHRGGTLRSLYPDRR